MKYDITGFENALKKYTDNINTLFSGNELQIAANKLSNQIKTPEFQNALNISSEFKKSFLANVDMKSAFRISEEFNKNNNLMLSNVNNALSSLTSSIDTSAVKTAAEALSSLGKDSLWKTVQEASRSMSSIYESIQDDDLKEMFDTIELVESEDVMDIVSTDDIQEANAITSGILKDKPLNWQQNFMLAWDKYKVENPVIAILILKFVNWIIPIVLGVIGGVLITTANAYVRTEPSPKASVISKIPKGMMVTAYDDVKYYVGVMFEDEDGNIDFGYIAKKNVTEDIPEEE